MNLSQAITTRVIELCRQYGITINGLGTICGITQSTLNNIVNGGSKNPTISTIKKICDGLDMRLSDFFNSPLFNDLDQEVK